MAEGTCGTQPAPDYKPPALPSVYLGGQMQRRVGIEEGDGFCIETPSQILTGVSGPAWGSTNNNITIAVYLHRCVKRWLSLGDFGGG